VIVIPLDQEGGTIEKSGREAKRLIKAGTLFACPSGQFVCGSMSSIT